MTKTASPLSKVTDPVDYNISVCPVTQHVDRLTDDFLRVVEVDFPSCERARAVTTYGGRVLTSTQPPP